MNTAGKFKTPILLGVTAIQGLCFVLIKAGLAYAPPLLFGGLRALIGGAALLALIAWLRQPLWPRRESWGGVLAMALTATSLGLGAMFLSPGHTAAGIASVLGNAQPLLLMGLAAAVLGERMTRGRWITLALGLTGVILISWEALARQDGVAFSGAALALIASASGAIGSVIFKRMRIATGLLSITAWQLILGSLPLLGVSALVERQVPVTWNIQFLAVLLFLALIGTSFVTAAWYWLVQGSEVGHLAQFLFLVPVFGLAISTLFGERVGLLESAGSLLMIASIGIAAILPERQVATVRAALQRRPMGLEPMRSFRTTPSIGSATIVHQPAPACASSRLGGLGSRSATSAGCCACGCSAA